MLQVPWHAFQEPSVLRHVAALTAAVWGFQGVGLHRKVSGSLVTVLYF